MANLSTNRLWSPIAPHTLFKSHLPSTLGLTDAVQVVPDTADPPSPRKWKVSWTAQPTAVKYVVFASPHPINRNKFTDVIKTQTSVDFEIPFIVPDEYIFYFWVAYENPSGVLVFLQDAPVFTTNNQAFENDPLSASTKRDVISYNDEMKFNCEEMRRRNLAILETNGEDFYLFIRRMAGQSAVDLTEEEGQEGRVPPMYGTSYTQLHEEFDPDEPGATESNEASDPEYHAPYRNPDAMGTGIAGGFLPRIRIRARYGSIPRRELQKNEQGIELIHPFNSWTLWHPRLKSGDLLVRVRSGERFLITEAGQSEMRGMVLHQEFNARTAPRTAVLYNVSDEVIRQALENQSAWSVGRWSWAIWS